MSEQNEDEMKRSYQRPDATTVEMQQTQPLLSMSIQISGYSKNSNDSFTQDDDEETD